LLININYDFLQRCLSECKRRHKTKPLVSHCVRGHRRPRTVAGREAWGWGEPQQPPRQGPTRPSQRHRSPQGPRGQAREALNSGSYLALLKHPINVLCSVACTYTIPLCRLQKEAGDSPVCYPNLTEIPFCLCNDLEFQLSV